MSALERKTIVTMPSPHFIADNLALDFINSEIGIGAKHTELLNDDAQVIEWLRCAGVASEIAKLPLPGHRGTLLKAALALRGVARELILSRHAGRVGDASALNRVLARGNTYHELIWKKAQTPERVQHRRVTTPEDLLVPIAEAIAALLTDGDFALIRKCENPGCTLWFYDHTKSHRRRWCSMAVCGNRMKVALFRARQKTT